MFLYVSVCVCVHPSNISPMDFDGPCYPANNKLTADPGDDHQGDLGDIMISWDNMAQF